MSTSTGISRMPTNKSRKTGCTGVDHISNLPDCVTSHILSRLPTKDTVRTSILSKHWEYKWTFSNNVELDDSETVNYNESNKAAFANFVDRTLLLSRNFQSFRLSCRQKYGLIRMKTWISALLSRNVHSLYIYYPYGIHIVLPFNLLISCYSLRRLELDVTPSTLGVSAEICFPLLTFFKLEGVEILNELRISDVVKFNLPVVEAFELMHCDWLNVKFVEIYAPKMIRFKANFPSGVNDYSIKINGDNLVDFLSIGGLPENIVLSGGSEIVYAELYYVFKEDLYHSDCGKKIRELLNGFLSLKELTLSDHGAETTDWNDHDYDAEEYVPSCIVSHLERVQFYCCNAGMDEINEMKLAKYILKNAVTLKRLHLSSNKIAEELSTYPKASTCLTISFCSESSSDEN